MASESICEYFQQGRTFQYALGTSTLTICTIQNCPYKNQLPGEFLDGENDETGRICSTKGLVKQIEPVELAV